MFNIKLIPFGIANVAVGGILTIGIDRIFPMKLGAMLLTAVVVSAILAFTVGKKVWETHFE